MNNVTSDSTLDLAKRRRVPRNAHQKLERFLVEQNDVLFNATNSPENVGKSVLIPELDEFAVYSNHFIRLRPDRGRLDPAYLWRWLQWQYGKGVFQSICQQWVNQATVSRGMLLDMLILVPPLDDQRRIAAILDHADSLRAKRCQVITQLDDLAQSIFLDMFGNPITNPMRWPTVGVEQVCTLVRGSSPRPQGDPRYFGGPVPRLMISDITRDGNLVTPRTDSLTIEGAKRSRPCQRGTVVMAVSGNIGLVSQLAVDACIHDGFVGFTQLDEVNMQPRFLLDVLSQSKAVHDRSLAGAIFKNVTTTDIKAMKLIAPPPRAQRAFVTAVTAVERSLRMARDAITEIDALFASLQSRAFRGEL